MEEQANKLSSSQKKPHWLKWGCLGLISLSLIFIVAIFLFIKSVTPLIKIDKEKKSVNILGGLVEIDGGDGEIKVGENWSETSSIVTFQTKEFSGNTRYNGSVTRSPFDKIVIQGTNGKFGITQSENKYFYYDCRLPKNSDTKKIINSKMNKMFFDLSQIFEQDCDFQIPKNVEFEIKTYNGKINLIKLEQNMTAQIYNGKIDFEGKESVHYNIDAHADVGMVNGLTEKQELTDQPTYSVNLRVNNGAIDIQ